MAYQNNNKMVQKPAGNKPPVKKQSSLVRFDVNGQTVELSPQIVHDYLVSGDKDRVTMQELVMFINLCKFSGLNPWLREAYCIKYGSEPATMVTGKAAFEKRAESHPQYNGNQAGIITFDPESGVSEYRIGSFRFPGEEIIGGWAEVWRKDRDHSIRIEVPFEEYCGRKKDGSMNGQWSKKPGTMIRKVALCQALREAFPQTLGGMYDISEMGVDESVIDTEPITPPGQDQTDVVLPDFAVPPEDHQQPAPAQAPNFQAAMNQAAAAAPAADPSQPPQVSLNDLL